MAKKEGYKTKKDMLKSGAILQVYGSKAMLSVCPAPEIEKVRFSIVKLGTSGKDALDFYMSLDDMWLLINEIDSGIAARRITADNNSAYPGAYKYVTGENGSKRLNIGGGKKGVRVQIQIQGQQPMMTIIQLKDLAIMSLFYKIVMGLIPVSGFYQKYADAFWEGVEERKTYHAKNSYDPSVDGDYVPPFVKEDEEQAPEQDVQEEAAEVSTPAVSENASESGSKASVKPQVMTATAIGAPSFKGSGDAVSDIYPIVTSDGTTLKLVFRPKTKEMLGDKYKMFLEKTKQGKVPVTFTYYKKGDILYAVSFGDTTNA